MPLTAGPAAAGDLEGSSTHVGVDAWVRSLLIILEVKNVAAWQEDNERFLCPGGTPGYRGTVAVDCCCPIIR